MTPFQQDGVRGYLHEPYMRSGGGLLLTHGAGGNAASALLVKIASAFADIGFVVLRFNLPFRQRRPHGPPSPGVALQDRIGIETAVGAMRSLGLTRVFVGGQSYGGRQATMLAAEKPGIADGLLLLSYPLHPPGKTDLRTAHFPAIHTPALFVQGSKDPFGKPDELESAITLIPAPTALSPIEGAGHDLKSGKFDIPALVIEPFRKLFVA